MLQWLGKWFRKAAVPVTEPEPAKETGQESRWRQLEEIIGFPVRNAVHYERALRHRSIIDGEKYEKHETYERLEFLGDAVLDLIVTEILFQKYPQQDEGFMTKLRAKIVKGDTLATLAADLGLNRILEVGERARGQGIELSKSVLADVFEALVAAIYLTEGYGSTFGFIQRVIEEHLDLEEILSTVDNFKSLLLEYTQSRKLPLPKYRVLSETGPGHDKTFEVAVSVDGHDYGTGTGKNKKQAEQIAAKHGFHALKAEMEAR